ncbi:uncharacterized protein RBU33_017946 [Hipposideros larvatus]
MVAGRVVAGKPLPHSGGVLHGHPCTCVSIDPQRIPPTRRAVWKWRETGGADLEDYSSASSPLSAQDPHPPERTSHPPTPPPRVPSAGAPRLRCAPRQSPAPLYAPSSFTPVAGSAGTWGRGEWGRGAGQAGGGRGWVLVSGIRSPFLALGARSCVGLSSSLSWQRRGDYRSRPGTLPSRALGTRVSSSLFPGKGRPGWASRELPRGFSLLSYRPPLGLPGFSPAAEVEEIPDGSRRPWSPEHGLWEARPTTLQRAEVEAVPAPHQARAPAPRISGSRGASPAPGSGGARRREDPEASSAWACLGLFTAGLLLSVAAQSRGFRDFAGALLPSPGEEGAGSPQDQLAASKAERRSRVTPRRLSKPGPLLPPMLESQAAWVWHLAIRSLVSVR